MVAVGFDRITVATDGSLFGQRAVETAIDLARRYQSKLSILAVAPLIPLYVSSGEPWVPTQVPPSETDHYRAVVNAAVQGAEAAGVTAVSGVLLEGVVVDEIIAHLEQNPADLLVLGSRGLSTAKRLLLGSVSDAVIHHLKVPVLLARAPS
jgi:nucleotide-binding universal stress UspA family protein